MLTLDLRGLGSGVLVDELESILVLSSLELILLGDCDWVTHYVFEGDDVFENFFVQALPVELLVAQAKGLVWYHIRG